MKNDNLKLGRLAGFFLLMMVVAGIPGVAFRGIGSSMLADPELLQTLLDSSATMRLSILLSMVAGVFGLLFSITAYRVMEAYSKPVAVAFVTLWSIQMAVGLVGDVMHYTLLETAQLAARNTIPAQSFLAAAAIGVNGYIGAHFLSLILFGGTFVFMHASFMKFGLLPKWLTIWGMLATGTVFTVTWLRIFDHYVSFHFYNQNGLFMIGFTLYMLIKGFQKVSGQNTP